MPAPNAGCITSHGAAIVATPTASAGHNVGAAVHSRLTNASSTNANAMPIE
jgi:hypothetical protein